MPRLIPSRRRADDDEPEVVEAAEPVAEEAPAPQPATTPAVQTAAPLPAKQPRRIPNVGLLRRERRLLMRTREERIRDLGGLMLEMFKRDRFREDIVLEHCAQLVALENRLHEINILLTHASGRRRAAPGPHCECGAALLVGARFCASCGRAVA